MMNNRMRRAGVGMVLAALALSGAARGEDSPAPSGAAGYVEEMVLTLDGALWGAKGPGPGAGPLVLRVRRKAGAWGPEVWGYGRRYNNADHHGLLQSVTEVGRKLWMELPLKIESDKWTQGGMAAYRMELVREGETISGTWEGTFKEVAGKGVAHGEIVKRQKVAGFVPVAAGEHPRVLIRKGEIEGLREKARSEWGQKMLGRLSGVDGSKRNMAAGEGMLYVITGEKSHADKARALIDEDVAENGWISNRGEVHGSARQTVETAIAFDLIYDAMEPAWREKINGLLTANLKNLYNGTGHSLFNPGDVSNWSAMYRSGCGVAALVELGERMAYPPEPKRPGGKAVAQESLEAYAAALAEWQAGREVWEKAGRTNTLAPYWLGVAKQRIENWADQALGEHGWNTEGEAYTQHALRLVLPFAHGYGRTMGEALDAKGHLGQVLALDTGKTIFGAEGARMASYAPGGGPLGVDNFARGFGLVPEELKGGVLWGWDRTQALADAGKFKDVYGLVDQLDPLSAAMMLVNYPVGVKEKNPAEVLGHVIADEQKGGYVFRNRWQDADDCVAMIHFNNHFASGGWNAGDAGEFRISGLGVDWAVRGGGWGHGGSTRSVQDPRLGQSVLHTSEVTGFGPKQARVIECAAGADGSGVVMADMAEVYQGFRETGTGQTAKGKPVVKREDVDLGIRGVRGFAADYSGKSGAPGLFVVADQVTGTKGRNTWQMATMAGEPLTAAGTGPATQVSATQAATQRSVPVAINGNRFLVKGPNGATLVGMVVGDVPVKIHAEPVAHWHEINYHGNHRRALFPQTLISADGGEYFLVVMTVQRGEAPKISVENPGPGAVVTVGGQRVRFDGKRIVLGEQR